MDPESAEQSSGSPLAQDIRSCPCQQSQFQVGPGWEMALECELQKYSAISLLLYFLITQFTVTPPSFRAAS